MTHLRLSLLLATLLGAIFTVDAEAQCFRFRRCCRSTCYQPVYYQPCCYQSSCCNHYYSGCCNPCCDPCCSVRGCSGSISGRWDGSAIIVDVDARCNGCGCDGRCRLAGNGDRCTFNCSCSIVSFKFRVTRYNNTCVRLETKVGGSWFTVATKCF